ncbi:restriction endonuclease subunit S [Pontibacter sp. CAU 1760]
MEAAVEITAAVKNVPALRFPEFEEEWKSKELETIVDKTISYGIVQAGEHVENGMPYIKSQDLNTPLGLSELQRTSDEIAKKYRRSEVEPGDIVFSLRGNIGGTQIVPESIEVANLTQGTARISVSTQYSNHFVRFALQNANTLNRILSVSKGSTFQEVSLGVLRKITVKTPDLPEQQKIASFLSAADDKIQQLSKKKTLLEKYKKGVMQRLFKSSELGLGGLKDERISGGEDGADPILKSVHPKNPNSDRLRFKDDNGNDFPEWEVKKLGEVFERVKTKNAENNKNVLTISAQQGLINQEDFFNKSVSADNVTGYYLLHKGDFAYNKSYSKGYPMGAIKRLTKYEKGVVSTLYICFKLKDGSFEEYFEQYFESGGLNRELHKIAQEGARNHGLLNMSVVEFFADVRLPRPSLEEQIKIANFLTSIDNKITYTSTQLEQAQQFKKGLLQQLFV